MKSAARVLFAMLTLASFESALADVMVSGGKFGAACVAANDESEAAFFDREIAGAAKQAAYFCLAMSQSGASQGSIMDICAGVRNDERLPDQQVERYATALTQGGGDGNMRLTQNAKPNAEIERSLAEELIKVKAGETYARNRAAMLERLGTDLENGREACGKVETYERNEVLRAYNWKNVPELKPKVLEECRSGLQLMRLRNRNAPDPRNNEVAALLETSQRFIDRIRGLTLHPNPNTLNQLDLHQMAKQSFETLDKRIKYLVTRKAPSQTQFAELGNDDPDFAARLACQFKISVELPSVQPRDSSSAAELFKKKLIDDFVVPDLSTSRFSKTHNMDHMDMRTLEELTYLIGTSQFQRAIWLFEENSTSLEMREFFETSLGGKQFTRADLATTSKNKGLGANESSMITLNNGIQGIFKPFVRSNQSARFRENFRGEAAANEIDKILGLRTVPVSVVTSIDGREGSFQLLVTQALTPASVDLSRAVQMGEGIAAKSWQVNMLDGICLNPDRQNNIGNIMVVVANKHKVAIDNGLAFTAKKDFTRIELLRPKPDSARFIPQSQEERIALAPNLDKYIATVKNNGIVLHDDERLNQCAKLLTIASSTTFMDMLVNCKGRSDQECNSYGADRYQTLTADPVFTRDYTASKCGT